MNSLSESIDEINVQISNLEFKKRELISKHVEPIVKDIISKLREHQKGCVFTFSVDNPAWNDEDCVYHIYIRFPNGYTFRERLDFKHKIIDFVHKNVEDDFALSKIMILGAI